MYEGRAERSRAVADLGRILIADDDENFLFSTAALLGKERYECDCVTDAFRAAEKLKISEYNLLIAGIKIPGNGSLELVRNLPEMHEYIPVILVTAYPSLKSAIDAIHLPVEAYLVKPVDFYELLVNVQKSIKRYHFFKTVRSLRKRLQEWSEEIRASEVVDDALHHGESPASLEAFLALTLQNIFGSLADLTQLTKCFTFGIPEHSVCHLFNCPRLAATKKALMEATDILEKTKRSFKSKELGHLRGMLEDLLKDIEQ